MYTSELIKATNDPGFNPSPPVVLLTGQPMPDLNNTEDSPANDISSLGASPAFVVQPPTRENTPSSPQGESLEVFGHEFQKFHSPKSIGSDRQGSEPGDSLSPRSESCTSLRRLSATAQYGTSASTTPIFLFKELPHSNDPAYLRTSDAWGHSQVLQYAGSALGSSEPGSNLPSPYSKPRGLPRSPSPGGMQPGEPDYTLGLTGSMSKTGRPNTRTKKRCLDDGSDQEAGEREPPKRSKIDHHDYMDACPNHAELPSHEPEQIPCEEIFQRLVAHGCADLSSDLDPKAYSPGPVVGGAFGDIWKGRLFDGTKVAIKRAMKEIYYWSKAKHKYVQELMGVVMFQGRLAMVSRWMDNGNLREYLCKNPSADRYSLCIQVATGVAYLHSQGMVHGDLKGANILVSGDGSARLSDFDYSIMSDCSLAFSDTSKLGGGTTRWMAPELILQDNCTRSAYTDVYSLGMTMLEIITGTPPYYPQYQEDVQVIRAIMKEALPTRPMGGRLGDNIRGNLMWGLLLSCWNYDPLARPKATEVVKSLHDIINPLASGPV